MEFSELLGKTLTNIQLSEDEIIFETKTQKFILYHSQDCCEEVYIEDICGDLSDLVGNPILLASEVSNVDIPPKSKGEESYTWTFYNISTIKGSVTIRWYGTSNGYYSESVDFKKLK